MSSSDVTAFASKFLEMAMLQHHLPNELSDLSGLEDTEIYRIVDKEEAKHRYEIAGLLGLKLDDDDVDDDDDDIDDVGDDVDEVLWNRKGLGLQSRSFELSGSRWRDLGGQCVTDQEAADRGTAFAKVLSSLTIEEDHSASPRESERKETENRAHELGKTTEEMSDHGGEQSDMNTKSNTEVCKQMKHGRTFLRVWAEAEAADELKLPEDTLLVIPRLYDNVIIRRFASAEEEKPTMLVLEDLNAAGFEAHHYWNALPREDVEAVVLALADLHAAMWRIHERLDIAFAEDIPSLSVDEAATAKKDKAWTFKRNMKTCFDSLHEKIRDKLLPYLDDMANVYMEEEADTGICIYGHGDPWAHNFMLRRDPESGKVDGVAFVDFGSVKKMSPLIDFYGFLATSVQQDVFYSIGNKGSIEVSMKTAYNSRMLTQMPDSIKCNVKGQEIWLFNRLAIAHAHATIATYFWTMSAWRAPVWTGRGPSEPLLRQNRFLSGFRVFMDILKREGRHVTVEERDALQAAKSKLQDAKGK